jgi:dipeptidyl aminopeptidase/acylaminoacyl peptidase
VRAGTLVAQRLDLARRTLVGDQVVVADSVGVDAGNTAGGVSVSASGPIANRASGAGQGQLRWVDRTGKTLGAIDAPGDVSNPRVSPDGRRVVVQRTVQGNTDLWLLDGIRVIRFTFDAARDAFALWSPDGKQIVFDSVRTGGRNLYVKAASGAGSEERLLESSQINTAWD